jgi:DNA polymerase III subunit delta'
MPAPYPWHAQIWLRLLGMRARVPHSVLLAGPKGIGKLALANAWAQSLLCESPSHDGNACGSCEACHWFEAGTHPDFMHLTLLEKENKEGEVRQATEISVDQARQAVDFVQLSTYRAGRRLVLIEPAEALNTASANALLKVLEEPPINTIFILVSHQARQLLPTILSRCHKLEIGLPDMQDMQAWLKQNKLDESMLAWASGAPLAALESRETGELDSRRDLIDALADPVGLDSVALAEAWNRKVPARTWHQVNYKWLLDLLACHLGGKAGFNPDYAKPLQSLAKQVKLAPLLDLIRQESFAGRWVDHPLNRQMVMEAWLISYTGIFEGR